MSVTSVARNNSVEKTVRKISAEILFRNYSVSRSTVHNLCTARSARHYFTTIGWTNPFECLQCVVYRRDRNRSAKLNVFRDFGRVVTVVDKNPAGPPVTAIAVGRSAIETKMRTTRCSM